MFFSMFLVQLSTCYIADNHINMEFIGYCGEKWGKIYIFYMYDILFRYPISAILSPLFAVRYPISAIRNPIFS